MPYHWRDASSKELFRRERRSREAADASP